MKEQPTDMTELLARLDAIEQTQQEILTALRMHIQNDSESDGYESKIEAFKDFVKTVKENGLEEVIGIEDARCSGSSRSRKSKMEAFKDFVKMVKENGLEDVIDIEDAFYSGSWETLLD